MLVMGDYRVIDTARYQAITESNQCQSGIQISRLLAKFTITNIFFVKTILASYSSVRSI